MNNWSIDDFWKFGLTDQEIEDIYDQWEEEDEYLNIMRELEEEEF